MAPRKKKAPALTSALGVAVVEEVEAEDADTLVVPFTGEIVSRQDPEHCARVLFEIRDLEQKVRDLKDSLKQALLEESQRVGTKTLHYPGLDAVISTPVVTHWDTEILLELLDAGLPEERYNDLVTMEVSYKVNGLVAKSIGASNPIYGDIVDRAKTKVPRATSVAVNPTKRIEE